MNVTLLIIRFKRNRNVLIIIVNMEKGSFGYRYLWLDISLMKFDPRYYGRLSQAPFFYVCNLCGLWFLQFLLEHLSGMVFVPCIISEPQNSQIFPVGFALMANLHFG